MEVIEATLDKNGIPVNKALVQHRGQYYIVSESTRLGLETLIFLSDSEDLADKAAAAGVDVELAVWPPMFHDWWLFGQFIPETKQCLTKVSQWLGD